MRKKGICFGLILALLLPFVFTTEVKASDNTELNIYAFYLNSEKKGDSTLLESKGHYLLIDIGADNHAPAIIKQLQTLGVTHVDVMFSHLHTDHTGGCSTDLQAGLKQFALSGITIDTLYLPDPSLAVLSRSYPSRYAAFQAFMSTQGTGRIVYLNVGDQVNVGDATGKVIGPVNTNEISPYAYTSITKEKESFIRYENNCSLAVIFTCGNTRYFTAGDSYSDESDRLVSRYGTSLKCDIMKMNHHGIGSGNSVSLLEAVQPSYAFIPNTGVSETDAKTNKWRTGTAIKRMTSYGLCYLVGNEEKTLIFHIENDKITLYRGDTVETGKKMTGWQSLYGADGLYRDHDMYYFDKNGSLSTGVKMIGKHYYYFRKGGQMDYGTYNSEGNYSGWHSYNGKKRYFRLSDDENYAYMDVGRKKIGSETYYFDKNGYKLIPDIVGDDENVEDDIYPTQIGSDYYYLNEDGAMTEDDWINIDGEDYFFVSEETLAHMRQAGKIIELREYHTKCGVWKYFTAADGQINLEENSYIVIGTLESYREMCRYYGREKLVPIYIQVEDGLRLERALKRERLQEEPKYAEMCRRFLADAEDFSAEKLEEAQVHRVFQNIELGQCLEEIEAYIANQEG